VIIRILRSTAVCLLLLIFLTGSTGISFYIHTCGTSHKKEVFAFREIFHQNIACCCDENFTVNVLVGSALNYNDADYCRISRLFIKAPFLGFPVVEKLLVPTFHFIEIPEFALLRSQPVRDSKASFTLFHDPSPPPLSGINLVHFLHQIRIPAPVC
jgi:hypothetical protein